jgi:mono/diheme cytochrome c family protein
MKSLAAIVVFLFIVVVAVAVYVWSGTYNIAANVPHWDITHEFLEIVREKSIAAHSKDIKAPPLDSQKLVDTGFHHYHPMCRLCHGAPGYPMNEFAMGLYPKPPNLQSEHVQEEFTDAALFWVVKNGLKMTGMPAFGATHSDDELWGIVAFTRRLPGIQPNDYENLVKAAGLGDEADHHHDH